jgi:hypothetical protein
MYLLQSSPADEYMDILAVLKGERDKAAQQVNALDTAIRALSELNSTRASHGPHGTSQRQVWHGSEPHRGRDGQRSRGGAKATSLLNAPSKDFLDLFVRQYRRDSPLEPNARHCVPT